MFCSNERVIFDCVVVDGGSRESFQDFIGAELLPLLRSSYSFPTNIPSHVLPTQNPADCCASGHNELIIK